MKNIIVKEVEIKEPDNFIKEYEEINKYIIDDMVVKNGTCKGMGSNVIIPNGYQIIGMDDNYNYIGNGKNIYKIYHIPEVSYHTGLISHYPLGSQSIIPEKEYILTLACALVDKGESSDSTKLKDALSLAKKGDYSLFDIDQNTLDRFKEIKSFEYHHLMKNTILRIFGLKEQKRVNCDKTTEQEYIRFIKEITQIMKVEKLNTEEDYKSLYLK